MESMVKILLIAELARTERERETYTDDKPHQQCLKGQSQWAHAIQAVTISARLLHP